MSDLDRYYAWQLEELRRREALMGCMLPDLIEGTRLPKVRSALRKLLSRTEEQLGRLGGIIHRNEAAGEGLSPGREGNGRWSPEERGAVPMQDMASLVRARELAVLAACSYGWTQLVAERLRRPDEGRLLRRSLEEQTAAKVDLMRLAAELLSPGTHGRLQRHA